MLTSFVTLWCLSIWEGDIGKTHITKMSILILHTKLCCFLNRQWGQHQLPEINPTSGWMTTMGARVMGLPSRPMLTLPSSSVHSSSSGLIALPSSSAASSSATIALPSSSSSSSSMALPSSQPSSDVCLPSLRLSPSAGVATIPSSSSASSSSMAPLPSPWIAPLPTGQHAISKAVKNKKKSLVQRSRPHSWRRPWRRRRSWRQLWHTSMTLSLNTIFKLLVHFWYTLCKKCTKSVPKVYQKCTKSAPTCPRQSSCWLLLGLIYGYFPTPRSPYEVCHNKWHDGHLSFKRWQQVHHILRNMNCPQM